MIQSKFFLLVLFVCCLSVKMQAQYITIDDQKTPQELVNNVLINSSCINVETVSASGNPAGTGQSYAYFNAGTSNFPFSAGIVLATAPGKNAAGPYIQANSRGSKNDAWQGDVDLNHALNYTASTQSTVLEFDFVALTNSISFNYIFASNEYQSYFPCEFSDAFAFLIKEAGSPDDYKNLALLPGTNTPVSSTTVHTKIDPVVIENKTIPGCEALNEHYFNGNNTVDSAINYAGQTVVMNAQTEVIPNKTYHLKLVVADDLTGLFGSAVFIEAGSFVSKINFGEDKTIANNDPICFGEVETLDTHLDNAKYDFKWFKQDASNNYVEVVPAQTGATYDVQATGNYKVEATLKGTTCVSTGQIRIEFTPEILFTNTSLFQCDDNTDGISIFNLTKVKDIVKNNDPEITNSGYYESLADAKAKTNPIVTPEKYINKAANQVVFARIENKYNCFKAVEVTLKISDAVIPNQNPVATCDGDDKQDGFYQFDLNAQVTPQVLLGLPAGLVVNYYATPNDALTETNQLPNLFNNSTAFNQTIYARAVNGSDCYDIVDVPLVVNTFDPPNFEDESSIICKGSTITLSVATGFSSYLWNTGSTENHIDVTSAGDYSVTVKNADGCDKTKLFKAILSEPATITDAVVKEFAGIDNSILIQYLGAGNYEFSLDGMVYQDEPLFTRVNPGVYNAVAKDKNGCGVSNTFIVYVLDYPRFFTPNGDGYNDLWAVKDFDQLPAYKVSIFDRYGKLLKQMDQNSAGWNGLFDGQQLPSDDYWFTLILDNGRGIRGHFSLKR
jgi:gliding motility-associated-like protein